MNYISAVMKPTIPYLGPINGGLHVGKQIEIRGTVPYGADVFQINLMTALNTSCDRPLHLSIRFNGQVVVRNTYQRHSWGTEERMGIFPFAMGREFTLLITVQQNSYRICVNNQHCWEYNHRIPISTVNAMYIDGTVGIDRIDYINGGASPVSPYNVGGYVQPQPYGMPGVYPQVGYVQPPANPSYQQKPNLIPVYNPSIPYAYPITGGLKRNTIIYISGRPNLLFPHKFTINLQCGSSPYPPPDIAFHLDVRFFNKTIVRNTRTNNRWGTEELSVPFFPFQPGTNFDIVIRMNANKYMVAVNGQEFVEYMHRMKPLTCVNTLYIENDVTISSIRFA